jgi:hypothetical protein
MTKEEWITRATTRYVDRAGVSTPQARDFALALWEDREEDDTPEEAVDEDLSRWGD